MTSQQAGAQFRIGRFQFGKGAVLAPMAGITNPPFRQLCCEMGAVYCVTELVSCHAVVFLEQKLKNRAKLAGRKTEALMDAYPGESPHVVQLYGREPSVMAEAARIVADAGADIVDLNFGCPARKVIKNGEGCGVALMRDPDQMARIVRAVVGAVSLPVTAKTRLGYSATEKNGVEVAKILASEGAALITIHARTREQGHSGQTDLSTLARIVTAVGVPVVGNGGIIDDTSARRMMDETGCAAVAVGQGAKGNPWIFRQIAGGQGAPGIGERVAACRRHLELFVGWSGEERAVLEMRKHACWYLKGFDGAAAFRKRLGEATSVVAFNQLLDTIPVGDQTGVQ